MSNKKRVKAFSQKAIVYLVGKTTRAKINEILGR